MNHNIESQNLVRVRFAPSPTGWMHLGNVRAAIINALFAQQNKGIYILRIEDTDAARLIDTDAKQIIDDLTWLGITYNEGPFFQSQRTELYAQALEELQKKNLVYRAFETPEELEAVRQKQIAQGLPPRYNRASLALTAQEIEQKLAANIPFIWRFKVPEETLTIHDVARGPLVFDMQNFSDFAVTRQDGSFTFIFANFVDDMLMGITHIFRGEDHLTNSANQAVLYQAFDTPLPVFYHLPLICNREGKKLSKRDFGFSLNDLKESGFLPEAICNYLAIIGGSYNPEIMDFAELAQAIVFDRSSPAGSIQYDVEKLRWVNQKWIARLSITELVQRVLPFLEQVYPAVAQLSPETVSDMLTRIRSDMVTLHDAVQLLSFYFAPVTVDEIILEQHNVENYKSFFTTLLTDYQEKELSSEEFFTITKELCKKENRSLKEVFTLIRLALTGQPQGLSIKDLVALLGQTETVQRLKKLI